jgi:hypothetical protein
MISEGDLFQILLLVYEAELRKKILNVQSYTTKAEPFTPKIIGQLSFDAKSNYTIVLEELAGWSKSSYEIMIKNIKSNFKLPKDGIYKALLHREFLDKCEIRYSPDYQGGGMAYQPNLEFGNVLGKKVFVSKEDILAEKYTLKQLKDMDVVTLEGIVTIIGKPRVKFEAGDRKDEKVAKLANVIWLWIQEQNTINAMAKHWPIIENNPSWLKVFNRLNLHPESVNIYGEGKEENYLKCLGYIGILLDHLDRAEPLPADLYGKCLVLSEL